MYDVPRVAVKTIGRMEKVLEDFVKEAGSDDSVPESVQEAVAGVVPWVADAQTWVFTWVGPQVVDMLGYGREEWYESDFWADHIHKDDRDWAIKHCLGPVNTKGPFVLYWGYENHRVPISSDRGLLSASARQCEPLQSRSA